MYAGLEQAFPGLEVVSPAGVVKLTTAEVKEHGVGNEICTMAMAGELEVHSWSPPGLDASDRTKLEPAVNAMEAKIRADGGYSIICGFSMGGEVAYRLIDRLESIHAAVAERTRMVVLCCNGDFVMDTPPNPPTVGSPLKLFHMRGTGDAGYCDACRKAIDAPYFRCSECFDLDFCAACHATPEASLHRVPTAAKREKHLLTHRMAPAAPGDGIDHARLAAIAATGIEVVANVTYAGGHEMPKGQDPVYKQLAKFFAGTL